MVSRARARLTLIELDNILRCPPRKSESPQVHQAQCAASSRASYQHIEYGFPRSIVDRGWLTYRARWTHIVLCCIWSQWGKGARELILMVHSASERWMKCWHSVMTASSVFLKAGVLSAWHTALIIIIIIIIINVSLKYITNVTESKGIRIMKIALIV